MQFIQNLQKTKGGLFVLEFFREADHITFPKNYFFELP